jgi:hypothetical protein
MAKYAIKINFTGKLKISLSQVFDMLFLISFDYLETYFGHETGIQNNF